MDVKKPQNGQTNRIPHYEQVRFLVDSPQDGIKKGAFGTVVGSNGSPVESYEVDVGNRPVVQVHASEIELLLPTPKKTATDAKKRPSMAPPSPFQKS